MQAPLLSRDEQYKLLEEGNVRDMVRARLGGDFSRIGEIISLTQEEYVAWHLSRPLREDGWIKKSPGTEDGVYFINIGDTLWSVYLQERGGRVWSEWFSSYEEARRFFAVDYGLGRFLRSEKLNGNSSEGLTESPTENASSTEVARKGKKKWWQFW